jgi:hypothetical protein
MTALPRLPAPAARALAAAGLTTLEDCVEVGRRAVAELPGIGARALAVLDAAVEAAGQCDREPLLTA